MHIFFKKSTWFKNKIKEGAKDEYNKSWKELESLF